MASRVKSPVLRFLVIILCVILGTWIGIYLQSFSPIARFFTNFVDFEINIEQINIVVLRFGMLLALKLNLGSFLGGLVGFFAVR